MDRPADASSDIGPAAETGTSRRRFLGEAAATATVAWFWLDGIGNPLRRLEIEPTRPGAPRQTLSAVQWATLEAAQHRILPSGPDSPGAVDVNAIGYLDAVLADPDIHPDTVERVRKGADRLEAFARDKGAAGFAALSIEDQEEGIRLFEGTWMEQLWLRNVISFTLEAFLGDPIYGGNLDEIGWRWTGHVPAEPRPTTTERPTGRAADR
ncbi:MAG: gluconate 2-dehydrogenase subunit 3 family protein [Planctomycetota bacterium]|jgi:gluconate 2-dehydrogenase gamma chain